MFRRSKKVIQVRINTRGILLKFLDLSHHPLRFYIRERNTEKGKLEKQESVDSLCSCWSEKEDACHCHPHRAEWDPAAKRDVNPLLREYLLPHWLHTSRAAHPSDPWRPVTAPQTGLSLTHTSTPLRRSRGDGFKRDTLTRHWEEANGGRLNCDTCHWLV